MAISIIRLVQDITTLLVDIAHDQQLMADVGAVWIDIQAIFGIAARATVKKDAPGDIPL